MNLLAVCLLVSPLLCDGAPATSAGEREVPVKIKEGGKVVRGDDEIDSDDYTEVEVRYEIRIDKARKNASIWVRLDAFECNGDKTYGDTQLRLENTIHLYEAPEGKLIEAISDVPLKGHHSEFFKGERHGYQSFQTDKVGGLRKLKFTFDGKGGKDHNRMNLDAVIDFTPVLK